MFYFLAFFASAALLSAQRLRTASAILLRASGLMLRFLGDAAARGAAAALAGGASVPCKARNAEMAVSILARCFSSRAITLAMSLIRSNSPRVGCNYLSRIAWMDVEVGNKEPAVAIIGMRYHPAKAYPTTVLAPKPPSLPLLPPQLRSVVFLGPMLLAQSQQPGLGLWWEALWRDRVHQGDLADGDEVGI